MLRRIKAQKTDAPLIDEFCSGHIFQSVWLNDHRFSEGLPELAG